ncbi:hypothetical protein TWF225_000684 [Orbilia oligospora]|uniref:Uncharacterized protein n=1 Tax=Orbilia oligospora TaxID=2813651 RepID=A0A7C8PE63_ORBOL|nr:hypothetical protein TWF225_000684 [Orbilia oligospora]KAF3172383.1 hypothetical protein TWF751_005657 [Orbilia oligospora]KAF3235153.1 hypothetical protein TWF217_003197 [Orbilia oligospora]KAF3237226.1 hypothetical protein TWF128_000990 [Orbilia oligospora]KAF3295999.1 hypothetical protein TWF132_000540 [Orbilia oligospora]
MTVLIIINFTICACVLIDIILPHPRLLPPLMCVRGKAIWRNGCIIILNTAGDGVMNLFSWSRPRPRTGAGALARQLQKYGTWDFSERKGYLTQDSRHASKVENFSTAIELFETFRRISKRDLPQRLSV